MDALPTLPTLPTSPFPRTSRGPRGPAAVFIDVAGVLLDTTPSHGRLHGLRGGVGAALRLLDRLDYRLIALASCALDRRHGSQMMPARLADLLARERVALAGVVCCCCGSSGGDSDADAPYRACPSAPAMLPGAAREHGVALAAAWLVARDCHQLAAGQLAGCRIIAIPAHGELAAMAHDIPIQPCGEVQAAAWAATDGAPAYQARDIVDAALAIIRVDARY